MMHPCIWVSSTWTIINGEVDIAECGLCGQEKHGARYIVNTYSGVSRYEFFCHECQRRRDVSNGRRKP